MNTISNPKFTHQSITLSEQERRIVSDLMEDMSMTFSGALRFIVNDWSRKRQTTDKQSASYTAE